MTEHHKQDEKRRGFAILIVLAVIAMASVILATQLSSVRGQEYTQIRAVEEAKARDIAEHCLGIADAYAVAFGNNNNDFDLLLDPNGTIENSGTGDDFMPPAGLLGGTGTVVSIPPSGTTSKHSYRAYNVTVNATGGTSGTCFIRYDDNADDTNPLYNTNVTSNTPALTPVVEGANSDVAERDRDRTIISTVIGVVPQRADPATAYTQAHGRVTVRRIRAMPIGVNVGAAIQAGGSVTFGNNSEVCGNVAGVVADSVTGGCICGVLNAQLISGSQGNADGDCSCPTCASSTGSTITAGPRPNPDVKIPPYSALTKNEAYGTVSTDPTTNNISAATYPAATLYVRNAAAGSPSYVTRTYMTSGHSEVFYWDRFDDDTLTTLGTGGATQDCTDTSALDPLPVPCKWSGTTVTCAAGESPCWKLVARLDGAAADSDIDVTGNTRPEHSNGAGTAFMPRAGALPNGKGSRTWADMAPGAPSAASGLPSTTNVITHSGTDYIVANNTLATTPHMHVAIESTATSTTTIGALTRTGAKVTVSTNNLVKIAGSNQCCATCDCPQACGSATTMTKDDNGPGYAIRTNQDCQDTSAFGIVGHIMCANLDVARSGSGNCVVGGLVGLNKPGNIACDIPGETLDNAFCTSTAGFCAKNNFELIGDMTVAGAICLKNNLDAHGGIIGSESNIAWKNNPNAGQIVTEGNLVAGNNSTITFDGTGGALQNQGVAAAVWMDSTW